MDQEKVGSYIAKKRKELGLTQKELAELIEVTDKSISKWERGNGLPDVTRLKPLCDALKVSMNELVAGEDIGDEVLSQKSEENIMRLIKENETQKNNGKILYIVGTVLAVIAVCLLGISLGGSTAQAVLNYIDVVSILFLALFIGIGVLLGKDKSKMGIWTMIQKLAIPVACFISLFTLVLMLFDLSDLSKIGPSVASAILTPIYGILVYMISVIVKTHIDIEDMR